jgi:hypothetical protein
MITLLLVKKYNRVEYSYMGVFKLTVRGETVDPNVFVVKDREQPASSLDGSSGVPFASSSSSGGAEHFTSEDLEYQVTKYRTLVSVASLADLAALPTVSPGVDQLYRTFTFTVLCRSYAELEQFIQEVLEDLRTIARLQRADYQDFEVAVLQDAELANWTPA